MKIPLKKEDEDKISAIKKAYKEGMHIKSKKNFLINNESTQKVLMNY